MGVTALLLWGCANSTLPRNNMGEVVNRTKEFDEYWYSDEAEITSYKLEQARYGEIHEGTAVLVFVTEHFSKKKQVKADEPGMNDYSVMKLNFAKKFNTGIYPYSMMTSSFVPVDYPKSHATKVTSSAQEWCGHVFTQLNNRNGRYDIAAYSYFESEGDDHLQLEETWLEDELWNKIRLNPELLPVGKMKMIPSFFYLRLKHKELRAYDAELSMSHVGKGLISYSVNYPELKREITIIYNADFPYTIEYWKESYLSGWGESAKKLTTKATKISTIKSKYWVKNRVKDTVLREKLGLKN